MKTRIFTTASLVLALSGAACSDDGTTDAGTADGGMTGMDADVTPDAGTPAGPPTLGALIDRMGRPGVNTALTDPFNLDNTAEDTTKDNYNKAARATWETTYTPVIQGLLGVYDGLDRMCGNQFAAAAPPPSDMTYATLAGVLANDQLWLDTSKNAMCVSGYLVVEADATGIIPNNQCGGRHLTDDVIDTTYSVLAIGQIAGVGDGVDLDSAFSPTFPFLAAPNP